MDRRRIARRLGAPAVRRRRHRRVAVAAIALLAVAAVLVVAGSSDDTDDTDAVVDACVASNNDLADAQVLIRDNPAPNAAEEFLAGAFVDLARERSAAIRDADPGEDVLAVVDAFDEVVDAIAADPTEGIGRDPFEQVDERWGELGLDVCAIGGDTVAEG